MRLRPYSGRVFRNFATSIESQDLTDDLSDNPEHREILKGLFYTTSEKPLKSPVERVLEKSEDQIIQEEIDKRFNPTHWYDSRYSDGSWAVLYAAESEETALREALFHMMEFYREEVSSSPVPVQRRVLSLQIESAKAVDLTLEEGLDFAILTSKDKSGYPYCQRLARNALNSKAQLLRAPSARHSDGYCTPIFDRVAIAKDEGHIKYLRCILRNDRTAEVTSLIEEEPKVFHVK